MHQDGGCIENANAILPMTTVARIPPFHSRGTDAERRRSAAAAAFGDVLTFHVLSLMYRRPFRPFSQRFVRNGAKSGIHPDPTAITRRHSPSCPLTGWRVHSRWAPQGSTGTRRWAPWDTMELSQMGRSQPGLGPYRLPCTGTWVSSNVGSSIRRIGWSSSGMSSTRSVMMLSVSFMPGA